MADRWYLLKVGFLRRWFGREYMADGWCLLKVGFLRRWLRRKHMADGWCLVRVGFLRQVVFVLWMGGFQKVSVHQARLRVAALKILLGDEVWLGSFYRSLDCGILYL